MPCLVLLGTSSIQEYVFRSNRLRENLGASGLVAWAMHWWRESRAGRRLVPERGVIYIGGGNAALRFPSVDDARAAIREWSRCMLKIAPGLRLVTVLKGYTDGGLAAAYDDAVQELSRAENRPPPGLEPGAWPIVRTCPSTGLAAAFLADEIRAPDEDTEPALVEIAREVEEEAEDDYGQAVWLSAEAQAKRHHYWHHSRRRFGRRYGEVLENTEGRFRFPRDLSRLGTTAGASQIAIVHADGNGIGRLISNLVGDHRRRNDDAGFITELRALSGEIADLANQSFRSLIEELVRALDALQKEGHVELRKASGNDRFLPLRPIVDDGDDLTFVCHGKLGLALAARYLELFEQRGAGRGLTASAGVVVMPQKFPFAQAYALVEQLCGSAKRAYRAHEERGSWIDFHLQMEGRTGDLDSFRETLYPRHKGLRIPARPLYLDGESAGTWRAFEAAWEVLADPKKWPRSEAKRLLEAYPAGPEAVNLVAEELKHYKARTLALPGSKEIVFDALEFLDFHVKWHKCEEAPC